jgi:hypothetical protein
MYHNDNNLHHHWFEKWSELHLLRHDNINHRTSIGCASHNFCSPWFRGEKDNREERFSHAVFITINNAVSREKDME